MQRRWRLPKGVLRPRFAIKKRRFPPRPCSGIDSAVRVQWPAPAHADVNEEKAANSVLLRWTEGSRDGAAYRDMTAVHPADSTDDRAAVSPARRQAFWLVSSGPAKECTFCHFAAWAITWEGEGAKGCRTCGIYFQVGRLRTNSKVPATLGALTRRAGFVGRLRRGAPALAGD